MRPDSYVRNTITTFLTIRSRADQALAQVDDAKFFAQIDPESNSLALLVKHMAGNLRSRWTDFFTSDGEKPDRHRDLEFERENADSRRALMERWERGWLLLFSVLASLTHEDLERTVTIRGEPMSVFEALERQKEHYAYHAGQIVFLAKHLAGPAWKSLSIPRGGSEAFHREKLAQGTSARR
jgi:uncharacterized damage-inducible protein DinB